MKYAYLALAVIAFSMTSCGGGSEKTASNDSESTAAPAKAEEPKADDSMIDLTNKGIGPITSVELGDLDQGMADAGKQIFDSFCVACHKANEDFIGPAPKDILKRRSPEWVMNMILNPAEMTAKDPIAIQLLKEANGVPMVGQGLTEEQARQLLEYFRTL